MADYNPMHGLPLFTPLIFASNLKQLEHSSKQIVVEYRNTAGKLNSNQNQDSTHEA